MRPFARPSRILVFPIVFVLLSIGMAGCDVGSTRLERAREATLKHDLQMMREAIDNYTLGKRAAPQSLEDLQRGGYLREVPADPMTNQKDWVPRFDDVVVSPDHVATGMVDVKSNSSRNSPFDHTAYNTW